LETSRGGGRRGIAVKGASGSKKKKKTLNGCPGRQRAAKTVEKLAWTGPKKREEQRKGVKKEKG